MMITASNRSEGVPVRVLRRSSLPSVLLFFCLFILFTGCEKNEDLKKPVQVKLGFDVEHAAYSSEKAGMSGHDGEQEDQGVVDHSPDKTIMAIEGQGENSEHSSERTKSGHDGRGGGEREAPFSLLAENGKLHLRSIRLVGDRKKGDDIDFEREEKATVSLNEGSSGKSFQFDLPQGSYKSLELELRLGYSYKSALICEGQHLMERPDGSKEATPFRIDFEEKKKLRLEVEAQGGSSEFVLKQGDPRNLDVQLRTRKWFKGLPDLLWEDPTIVEGPDGEMFIPIEDDKNGNIHSMLLPRFESVFKARIL